MQKVAAQERPHGVSDLVDNYVESGASLNTYDLFRLVSQNQPSEVIGLHKTYAYDTNAYSTLKSKRAGGIVIPITLDGITEEMLLVRQAVLDANFMVTTQDTTGIILTDIVMHRDLGLHYCGYLKGKKGTTLVSLSLFENAAYGFISIEGRGNYAINQADSGLTHILYNTADLPEAVAEQFRQPFCGVNESNESDNLIEEPTGGGQNISNVHATGNTAQSAGPVPYGGICYKIFVEVSSDVYRRLSSDLPRTFQYTVALFSQTATIYLNERIGIKMSHLNIWTRQSPYETAPATLADRLSAFENQWGRGFNGDAAIMLDFLHKGGYAHRNDVQTFCRSYKDKMGYAGLNSLGTAQSSGFNFYVPKYIWQIYVVAHELGHIFGSPHTHACAWNGNNTAIDGCAPAVGCATPSLPPYFSIMSYCHLWASGFPPSLLDFTHGFGQQPGDLLRNFMLAVYTSHDGCISECATTCPYSHSFYPTTSPGINFPRTWYASNFIQSETQYILGDGDYLEYNAGDYIDLNPGFEARAVVNPPRYPNSGLFVANIGGCPLDPFQFTTTSKSSGPNTGEPQALSAIAPMPSATITLLPNPSAGQVTLRGLPQAYGIIQVLDPLGRTTLQQAGEMSSEQIISIPATAPAGVYRVRVTQSTGIWNSSLMLVR